MRTVNCAVVAALLLAGACGKAELTREELEARKEKRAAARAANENRSNDATTWEVSTLVFMYEDNEIAADARLKGKRIQVTGIVGDVKKDTLDHPYIIVGTGKQSEIRAVQCSIAEGSVGRAATLHKGETVTVRGTVSGLVMNVQLRDCDVR